jgi:transcriptional regulator with XRE-family HTH domain
MAAKDPELMRLKLRQLLIAARNEKDLTQAELGQLLGRNQSFVSAYERGRGIEVVELIQIAEALGLDAKGVIEELG